VWYDLNSLPKVFPLPLLSYNEMIADKIYIDYAMYLKNRKMVKLFE